MALGDTIHEALFGNAQTVPEANENTIGMDEIPVFSNFDDESNGNKRKRVGLIANDIFERQMEVFGSWPKRVEDQLFVIDENYQVHILDTPAKLIAFFDSKAKVEWSKNDDCISQLRYYEFLRTKVERFDAIETVPHFPPRPNTYYAHPPLPQASGDHLNTLLAFFTPETEHDRSLLKAFFVTLLWGSEPGIKPMFLFRGPENDSQPEMNGRGVGKSTVVQIAGELVGGTMSFSAECRDFSKTITRLLSKDAMQRRLCLLDNLKTMKLSWADLEALVTSPVVSGHRLFNGEGQRPNNLIWAITQNGPTLSSDIAYRSVIIRLARPEHGPNWRSNVLAYIRENRWNILADIQALITSQNGENDD